MYTATTTTTKTDLKNTLKSNTIKNWAFDDSFYCDLEQATLIGEQIYPLEQALQKTRTFFDDLLADKGLFLFLHDIQHLKAEQLPSGDTKDFCEQSRLLWLHWFLGCQYPVNLSVATLRYKNMWQHKNMWRYKEISDNFAMWFELKRDLDFEKDYLSFCYEKLGVVDFLNNIPKQLRLGTLKDLYADAILIIQVALKLSLY